MTNVIVVLGIIAIALVGAHRQSDAKALSIEQGNFIKGLAAILLVLVHIQNALAHSTAYTILSAGGI